MDKYLVLEDGTTLKGTAYGADTDAYGELVFTTAMTGYLESITDPSYKGQILMFAFPTIANYPVIKGKYESDHIHVSGLVTKDAHILLPSAGAEKVFEQILYYDGVPGIDGIDTRALIRKIRRHGVMKAWIKNDPVYPKFWPDPMERDLIQEVCDAKVKTITNHNTDKVILFVNVGTKNSIIQYLQPIATLKIVPYNYDFNHIKFQYNAIVVSNGPGNPAHPHLTKLISFIKQHFGIVPIIGICMGHQLIARAAGAKTVKMKFGHRGSNHAVTDGHKIWITTHNHGYAVERQSIENAGFIVKQWDINDGTVEMIEHSNYPIFSVQYHPEASPGPHDTLSFFEKIKQVMEDHNAKKQ